MSGKSCSSAAQAAASRPLVSVPCFHRHPSGRAAAGRQGDPDGAGRPGEYAGGLHAGIITSRTAPLYAMWVDMDELETEGDGIPGDIVADEMLVVLREINAKRRRIGAKDVAAAAS